MTSNSNPSDPDDSGRRQVKDGPLRKSEEDADRENPDVGQADVSEESDASFEKWENDETE